MFDDEIRLQMVNVALTPPPKLGYPFRQWSLRKLRDAIIEKRIVDKISVSNLRIIMEEEVLAYQVVKTWKESKDPDFEKKKRRIDRLTRKQHNPPVVLAYDELGPLELRPHSGRHWQLKGHPNRVPGTYTRKKGARQFLVAFNYHKGTFFGRLRRRKRSKDIFNFFKLLRLHYPPEQRIYLIMDNLSVHKKKDIRHWARMNKVSFVFTPTNASWLNPIKCHFEDIKELALSGTDYKEWLEMNAALQAALQYKNSRRAVMLRAREERRKRRRHLWRFTSDT